MATGNQKNTKLTLQHFHHVPPGDEAKYLRDKLMHEWSKEAEKENPSLFWAYMRAFSWRISMTMLGFAVEMVFQCFIPWSLGRLINVLESEGPDAELYAYAACVVVGSAGLTVMHHVAFLIAWRLGMVMQSASIAAVYSKALGVNQQSMADVTTGHVVNLVSNDTERFLQAAIMLPFLILAPLQLAAVTYLVYREVQWAALCGIAWLVVQVPLHLRLGKFLKYLRQQTAKMTDQRVKLSGEMFSGMRVMKMQAWEKPFRKLITEVRAKEINLVANTNYVRAFNQALSFITPMIQALLVVIVYEYTADEPLTTQRIFTAMAYFTAVRVNMTIFFPFGVQYVSEMTVVFKRLQDFFLLGEVIGLGSKQEFQGSQGSQGNQGAAPPDSSTNAGAGVGVGGTPSPTRPLGLAVSVSNMSATWDGSRPTLTGVSLDVAHGELVAVVGPVASGKSTLLMAVLRELEPVSGTVRTTGKVTYASQEAWILAETVRENIIFGTPFDEARYRRVVKVCQLERDFSIFPDGDETEIGERGLTLSGGQRARISLARAAYVQADVYLLDDPLSAVDVEVGAAMFHECIVGFLAKSGAAVILVTHQVQFLSRVDRVLVLGNEGSMDGLGTYDDLKARHISFGAQSAGKGADTAQAQGETKGAPAPVDGGGDGDGDGGAAVAGKVGELGEAGEAAGVGGGSTGKKTRASYHIDETKQEGIVTRSTYAPRAVQLHPDGGQFDFVWPPARTMHTPMWALSTCGESDEIKKNTHPTYITAAFREQVLELRPSWRGCGGRVRHPRPLRSRPGQRPGPCNPTPMGNGGQFGSIRLPARTMHPHVGPRHVWCLT